MGEYIDIGLQSSILPFTLLISSVAVGIYALLGFETENDITRLSRAISNLRIHSFILTFWFGAAYQP